MAEEAELGLRTIGMPLGIASLDQVLDTRRSYPARQDLKAVLQQLGRHIVYVIRLGEQVMYVGASNYGPRDRLLQHLHGKTSLGLALRHADLHQWTVETYSLGHARSDLLSLEQELIATLEPTLNGC